MSDYGHLRQRKREAELSQLSAEDSNRWDVGSGHTLPWASHTARGSFSLPSTIGSSPHYTCASAEVSHASLPLSLPRKKLPLHHLVHRRYLPSCDLGDSLCLLETLQKVWVTPQVPHPRHPNPSIHPNPKLSFLSLFKCLSSQGPTPCPRSSISPLCVEPPPVLTTPDNSALLITGSLAGHYS